MTRVGCTGHQTLSTATRPAVAAALAALLAETAPTELIGLSSLAAGTDQLFAHTVLAAGGSLHVIIPSEGYAASFRDGPDLDTYTALLMLATHQLTLPFPQPNEEAYMAAGRAVADHSQLLLAVWDGRPAGGLGGTADVVTYARNRGINVKVVWPTGASRT